ncbi:MAG: ATP-binding cassette domain-containing protein [Firmicutes bacterium]|nr:ATP-binding cassette domain-containing protein [Bacillota bacterium]
MLNGIKQIECTQATVLYGKNSFALEDVNFKIEKGEFVFLTGRNGSGKSTILKLLSAQKKPTSGRVWVNGFFTDELNDDTLPFFRRKIGLLQADIGLLSDRTALENVEFAIMALQYNPKDIRLKAEKALSLTGVLSQKNKFPSELSGGERMRVMLARCLVNNPELLLLDEPTSSLDADEAWDLMCLLRDINRLGVTMVISCHDRQLVTIMKQRVITLVAGVITADNKKTIFDVKASDIFTERKVLQQREIRLNEKKYSFKHKKL